MISQEKLIGAKDYKKFNKFPNLVTLVIYFQLAH